MARRSGAALPSDPDAARDHLLDVAEERFERFGFRRVVMDEIATAAGVSRPTLYRYLGDREALIRQIVERRAGRLVPRVQRRLDAGAALGDKLVAGLLFLVEVGRKDAFIRELLGTPRATDEILVEESIGSLFERRVWGPALESAKASGEIPSDFDVDMAIRWITSINVMLIRWQDYDDLSPEYRESLLRSFFLPAFRG